MKAKEFRKMLPARVREHLPERLQTFDHRSRFSLVQFWYQEPAFHYEVWAARSRGTVEVGLHFEHKKSAYNAAMHEFFDQHFIEIRHELGEIWLEKWDRGWHKLYNTFPFPDYNEATLGQVSQELSRQIIVLQSILTDAMRTIDVR